MKTWPWSRRQSILNELVTDFYGHGRCRLQLPPSARRFAESSLPVGGKKYLVEHRLTPPAGQIVLVRFRLYAI